MSKVGIMYQREKEQSWSQAISEALASPAWQRLNHVAPQGVVLHPSWRGQVPPTLFGLPVEFAHHIVSNMAYIYGEAAASPVVASQLSLFKEVQ